MKTNNNTISMNISKEYRISNKEIATCGYKAVKMFFQAIDGSDLHKRLSNLGLSKTYLCKSDIPMRLAECLQMGQTKINFSKSSNLIRETKVKLSAAMIAEVLQRLNTLGALDKVISEETYATLSEHYRTKLDAHNTKSRELAKGVATLLETKTK